MVPLGMDGEMPDLQLELGFYNLSLAAEGEQNFAIIMGRQSESGN